MHKCRIYFNGINQEEFKEYLLKKNTVNNANIQQISNNLPSLSPEVAGLLIAGMSSTVALVKMILNYFAQKHVKGNIIINSSRGQSIQFPSDISDTKKKEIFSLLEDIEHIQITLKSEVEK